MKIIHISHCYYPSKGGVQSFFKNVSERLVSDYGDDVIVVTIDSMYGPERLIYKKIEPAVEVINGVKVMRFPFTRWHIKPLRLVIKVLRKLSLPVPEKLLLNIHGPLSGSMKKYLLNNNADAYCGSAANYYFMQLPLWKSCNFSYFGSIHLPENSEHNSLFRFQKKSIAASKTYIANTTFEKERLVANGIESSKIRVIGVGVDEKLFEADANEVQQYRSSVGFPPQATVVAYIGRIEKTKNVQLLIETFEQLCSETDDVYLLIAGSGGSYAEELHHHTSQLPSSISSRIKWKIDFDLKEKPLLFHSIDILVLPSNNESFGIVFLEAWVCKKPVIGANIGAVRNVINENVDGLLMNIDDQKDLEKKLLLLINDKTLQSKFGEAGYKKVMENYTWDIITGKLRGCYLENVIAN